MTPRRGLAILGLVALVAESVGALAPGVSRAAGSSAFDATESISRVHLVNGQNVVADQRTVALHVDATSNLSEFQQVNVSWSGAIPTTNGGQPALIGTSQQTNPFVLLECRGLDDPTLPPVQQLSPETCWTNPAVRFTEGGNGNQLFPPWRLDRYAPPDQRTQFVGQPSPLPGDCDVASGKAQYWLPFVGADGTTYQGGPVNSSSLPCAGESPDAGESAAPSNETYGITALDGMGNAKFDVWTAQNDASLGCSDTVPCALVAIPIEGVSCDPGAQGLPAQDQPPPGTYPDCTGDPGASGGLWWSASNWRNRITVPLHFAPTGNPCDVVSGRPEADMYGSELMTEATTQWASHFCLNPKSFKFQHVQFSDAQSRNLLSTGAVNGAFTSGVPPDGFANPVVSAPAALTGFAIAYNIDDAAGHPVTNLRLNARLITKLLTESYNPLNSSRPDMAKDPEFIALNPGIEPAQLDEAAASTVLALNTDADTMYAITSYMMADPDAKAFLQGKPDPWGMTVNGNYTLDNLTKLGISLPTTLWPLLDTGVFQDPGLGACEGPLDTPYLPLVASPVAHLATIANEVEFANDRATIACNPFDIVPHLSAVGLERVGKRFRLGITSLAEAHRQDLSMAALQTVPGTFVAPEDNALRATAKLLKQDPTSGIWPIPYDVMTTAAGAAAYPGAMVVYAQIPTSGLPAQDASDYAALLRFIAGSGQIPGTGNGQLPDGYLPMTAANNLGTLQAATLADASAVAGQTGASSGPDSSAGTGAGAASNGSASGGSGGAGGSTTGATGGSGGTLAGLGTLAGGNVTGTSVAAGPLPPVATVTPGRTLGFLSRLGGSILRLLLAVGLVALAAACLAFAAVRYGPTRRAP